MRDLSLARVAPGLSLRRLSRALIGAFALALGACGAASGPAPPLDPAELRFTYTPPAAGPLKKPQPAPACYPWSRAQMARLADEFGGFDPTDERSLLLEEWEALRKAQNCPLPTS